MIIKETFPENKIIREIDFKEHLNLIVDDSTNQEKSNAIGKTTALRLIDICLGANDKKSIYLNPIDGTKNEDLEKYVENNKIIVTLTVVDSLDKYKEKYDLMVELFKNGKRYINNSNYNKDNYNKELNRIFFDNVLNSPTFRQLIKMFVRIEQYGDNDKFLKFLHATTTDVDYEKIYNYLFELQSQQLSEKINDSEKKIKKVNDDLASYKKVNNFDSIDKIEQRLKVLDRDVKAVSGEINILIDSKKYQENENQIDKVKIEYIDVRNKIDESEYRLKRIKKILADAEKEAQFELDNQALKELYNSTSQIVTDLHKTFKELVKFNSELLSNKIEYFTAQKNKIRKELDGLEEKKEELFDNYSSIIMLIENNKIEEYEALQHELEQLNENRGKNIQILEIYNGLEDQKNRLEEQLKELRGREEKSDKLEIFNEIFSKYTKRINNEELFLYKNNKGFPIGISYMGNNFSTGTKKSVITAFDLAYQKFAREINKKIPNFDIHDVIESVDIFAINNIVKIVNENSSQYIVAVLRDKIKTVGRIKDSDIVLRLSESDKLFKI